MDRGLIVLVVIMSEMAVMCAICFYYVRKENKEHDAKVLLKATRRAQLTRQIECEFPDSIVRFSTSKDPETKELTEVVDVYVSAGDPIAVMKNLDRIAQPFLEGLFQGSPGFSILAHVS